MRSSIESCIDSSVFLTRSQYSPSGGVEAGSSGYHRTLIGHIAILLAVSRGKSARFGRHWAPTSKQLPTAKMRICVDISIVI